MIVVSICLSDIPKELITKAKNKKQYINLVVDSRREPDKFGNTHLVYTNQSKEDRENKLDKNYVGNGKEYLFNNNTQQQHTTQASLPQSQDDLDDDLPF